MKIWLDQVSVGVSDLQDFVSFLIPYEIVFSESRSVEFFLEIFVDALAVFEVAWKVVSLHDFSTPDTCAKKLLSCYTSIKVVLFKLYLQLDVSQSIRALKELRQ